MEDDDGLVGAGNDGLGDSDQFWLLVEDAEARGPRLGVRRIGFSGNWLERSGVEFGGGAGRRLGAARLELRKSDGEFGAVADALFDDWKNGDAGEIGEEMFEFYQAGFEFAVASGFGEFFEFDGLLEGKFSNGGAGDFGEMRAAA